VLNGLITKCICGQDDETKFIPAIINKIPVNLCKSCCAYHQHVDFSESDLNLWYEQEYDKQHHAADRYTHDRQIAKLRLETYSKKFPFKKAKLLDIGCNNGAFVDEACAWGFDAYGNEINPNIANARTFSGTLFDCDFKVGDYDMITMHDLLEHVTDPVKYLNEVHRILKDTGVFIVDFPRFFSEAGKHHWKKIEHLWMLDEQRLKDLLVSCNFQVAAEDRPIPSKIVYYCGKKAYILL
jgi:SAM-dependent methyltransferase